MKKVFFTIWLNTFSFLGFSNPIIGSGICLNELAFDSVGNWKLEIFYFGFADAGKLDSFVYISSSTSWSYLSNFELKSGYNYQIITNEDMMSSLNINPKGDSIYLLFNNWNNSKMIFGDYPNSGIPCPKVGWSLARLNNLEPWNNKYCFDTTPSFGFKNDTSGMMGTLKGFVFDKNKKHLTTGKFIDINTSFEINIKPDGSYSTRAFSCNYLITQLRNDNFSSYHSTDTISFFMHPDSVIYRDIYLLDTLVTSIRKPFNNSPEILKIYPNPLDNNLILHYEIALPIISTRCYLELIGIDGSLVKKILIKSNKGSLELPTNIKSGVYAVQLILNGKIYYSKKVTIMK
jgi:hypothetical protein